MLELGLLIGICTNPTVRCSFGSLTAREKRTPGWLADKSVQKEVINREPEEHRSV
jgi:hypothetical protein